MINYTQRWRMIIGWLTLFIMGTDLFVVSPLLPLIAHQFKITPSIAGSMVSAFTVMYVIGAPWIGFLADKIGKRTMIFIGLLGFAVGNALTSLAPSFPFLIASRILAGLSAAAIIPSINAITGEIAPPKQSGKWIAIVGSGLLMALWAGAPIGSLVSQIVGWKVVFGGLSVVSLGLAILNQKVWPNKKSIQLEHWKSEKYYSHRTVIADVIVTLLWGISMYGLYTYLGTALRQYNNFSPTLITCALVAYGIGATTGSLSGGRFADRWEAGRISMISLLGLGILLTAMALLFKSGIWLFFLLFFWAFAGYAFFPAFQSWLVQRFSDKRGMAMAWNSTALYIGITLGSLFGGWVITNWGFGILPLLCGATALFGGFICFIRTKSQ
ncbi:MFS transporter [Shimazuella sp. AN120528]|uniref:MFS transporter n=1 Tax=Shimazuella soli TaxID=1892854 RepID=UPI001F0EB8BA|nr:MFS transporter [Shimazuella soli]MCH5585761.1 MFS transporter [Shimazuella soli]